MDGKKAAKKLIKMYGKKNVSDAFEKGGMYKYKKGKATGAGDWIMFGAYSNYVVGFRIKLKDGRVSSMEFSG